MTTRPLQPLLHELSSCVAAPALLLCDRDGEIRPGGVSGWYAGDVRLADRLQLSVAGSALELVRSEEPGHDRQVFAYVARSLGDPIADPTVVVERRRSLAEDRLEERVEVRSSATGPVEVEVRLAVAGDVRPMAEVKQGLADPASTLPPDADGWRGDLGSVATTADGHWDGSAWVWRGTVDRATPLVARVTLEAGVDPLFAGGRPAPWSDRLTVEATDSALAGTVRRSLDDLAGLLLADDGDRFLAAGSPWFLTLFGRDSLWAARLLAPVDPALAVSTLQVLARRQGRTDDPHTEEQPGKILHEVRPEVLDLGDQVLPPVYYGSVDATPLWVATLADAWDWGAPEEQVRALLPIAERCLDWMREQSAATGWLRYVDRTGRGLSNQGWKDSHDSVQFADGRLAEPPIALSEVQAYAWEAATRGARLFRSLGVEPPPGLEEWAAALRERFATDFWVDTPGGGHVPIALDRHGVPVDSVTSNTGHVLASGILDGATAARTAGLLGSPALDSGFGLRTLTAESPRYSVLSYHGGTVWPHDTAIAVRGLAAYDAPHAAGRLAAGVLRAAGAFGGRLPELYGGDDADVAARPTAYPAACRPQAWSAAAPLAMLVDLAGLRVDRAAGRLEHRAVTATPLGGYALRGLRWGAHFFDLLVSPTGEVRVETGPAFPLTVATRPVGARQA